MGKKAGTIGSRPAGNPWDERHGRQTSDFSDGLRGVCAIGGGGGGGRCQQRGHLQKGWSGAGYDSQTARKKKPNAKSIFQNVSFGGEVQGFLDSYTNTPAHTKWTVEFDQITCTFPKNNISNLAMTTLQVGKPNLSRPTPDSKYHQV